jgi:hypothetical protein
MQKILLILAIFGVMYAAANAARYDESTWTRGAVRNKERR